MDRLADILDRRVAEDLYLARVAVDLEVDDVRREAGTDLPDGRCHDVGLALDVASRPGEPPRELLERQRSIIRADERSAVDVVRDLAAVDLPDLRRTLLELTAHV